MANHMANPMAIALPTLHCANARCQAPHTGQDSACQHCGTPLLRRYLWVVGSAGLSPGELLQERYWVVSDRIVLDTQPGMLPAMPEVGEDLPQAFAPYLHLFHHRGSMPQVYGLLDLGDRHTFLLEDAPIYGQPGPASVPEGQAAPEAGTLMPAIDEAWSTASPQRQLGWLWQIARLWGAMLREGVAQTLLEPELIRVDGSLIRMLELRPQGNQSPTFNQLGALWSRWAAKANPSVGEFIQALSERLLTGVIDSTEQLVPLLDKALAIAGEALTTELQVATCTDPGPSRSHNEDACLPAGGTFRLTTSGPKSITLVCDGLGGHDGGEVASQMASDTIHRYVQTPDNLEGTSPGLALQQAFYVANDELIERNNVEKRLQRQRMGTTVVATWLMKHLFYLGHVGDSRIYRITPATCQQLTVDDDVGSQSVTQGQNVYRHAVRPSTSGALVQALGITNSTAMRPTVQRYFFDEDTVLLLCSDGLSDHDRVGEVWRNTVLPTLTRNINVAVAAAQLLEVANQRNGHDNATIALVHYRIQERRPIETDTLMTLLKPWPLVAAPQKPRPAVHSTTSSPRTTGAASKKSPAKPQMVLMAGALLAVIGAVVGYGVWRSQTNPQNPNVAPNTTASPPAIAPSSVSAP